MSTAPKTVSSEASLSAPTLCELAESRGSPIRVQLRRVRGWKMPPNTMSVARPSKWGNNHYIGPCPECGVNHTREEAIAEYRAEVEQLPRDGYPLAYLRGKNLACYCKLNEPCHADVLLELANGEVSGAAAPLTNATPSTRTRQRSLD